MKTLCESYRAFYYGSLSKMYWPIENVWAQRCVNEVIFNTKMRARAFYYAGPWDKQSGNKTPNTSGDHLPNFVPKSRQLVGLGESVRGI